MTWVHPYWREPAKKTKERQDAMTDRLWNEFVGDVLIGELWVKMQEPLDDPQFDDLSVTDKRRLRETM